MKKQNFSGERLKEAIVQLASPVAETAGVSLLEITLTRAREGLTISVILQKLEGVSLGDCEKFSKAFGKVLDENDLISENYYLEVASPGIKE